MKWLLKNALAGPLLFPCNFLLLGALAWLLRKRRPRLSRVLGVASFAGLWFLSTVGVSSILMKGLEGGVTPLRLEEPDLARQAEAIVVLGAGRALGAREYSGRDVVSASGFLRLRYAREIQRRSQRPILTTGGTPDAAGASEGQLMSDALEESFGAKAKWVEGRSANTAENARLSFEILSAAGIKRIFLVTHATHMVRALPTFKNAGFEVVPAPMGFLGDHANRNSILDWIPSPAGVETTSTYFHELIGGLWYRLTGAI